MSQYRPKGSRQAQARADSGPFFGVNNPDGTVTVHRLRLRDPSPREVLLTTSPREASAILRNLNDAYAVGFADGMNTKKNIHKYRILLDKP